MVKLVDDEAAYGLQRLAREQLKLKLLTDIQTDMAVCELEGWDKLEYLRDLHMLIAEFYSCVNLEGA